MERYGNAFKEKREMNIQKLYSSFHFYIPALHFLYLKKIAPGRFELPSRGFPDWVGRVNKGGEGALISRASHA